MRMHPRVCIEYQASDVKLLPLTTYLDCTTASHKLVRLDASFLREKVLSTFDFDL